MARQVRNLITPSGFKKLQDEYQQLWREERPKVTQEVAEAAAHGDRSENAEYKYGKRRLREIDRRLEWLSKRLKQVEIVRPINRGPLDVVGFGSVVTVEDEDGNESTYQLVGTDEFDADNGKISVAAPIARALMGKRVDDEVEVDRPRGVIYLTILAIEAPDDPPA